MSSPTHISMYTTDLGKASVSTYHIVEFLHLNLVSVSLGEDFGALHFSLEESAWHFSASADFAMLTHNLTSDRSRMLAASSC